MFILNQKIPRNKPCLDVEYLYKTVWLIFGLCFIVSSNKTNYYENLEENNKSLATLFTEIDYWIIHEVFWFILNVHF